MSGKWVSNRGQVVQIGCAVGGLALGIYASGLPVKQVWEGFVAIWPAFVFPLVALVFVHFSMRGVSKKLDALSNGKPAEEPVNQKAPEATQTVSQSLADLLKPPEPKWLIDNISIETVRVRVGGYWETNADSLSSKFRISPLAIDGEPGHRKADVGFNYGGIVFHGGEHVTKISTNRFMMPIATSGFQSEERMVYEYSFSEEHIQFLTVRVDGIDSHSQEIIFQVARLRNVFRRPIFSDPK